MSTTLYIMYNVVDVSNVTVDAEEYIPLDFNVTYSMTPNTQQLPGSQLKYISSSMKTVSTIALTMSVTMLETPLVKKVLNILNETDDSDNSDLEEADRIEYNGNNEFVISFDCSVGDDNGAFKITIEKTYRLISAQIITAPNQVPSLQLGFIK